MGKPNWARSTSGGPDHLHAAFMKWERTFILNVLADHAGHREKTSRALGISRKNLWEKMQRHEIDDAVIDATIHAREMDKLVQDARATTMFNGDVPRSAETRPD